MNEPDMKKIEEIILKYNNAKDIFHDRYYRHRKTLLFKFWENHHEWKHVLEHPEINGHVLDFGCGSGHSDFFLAEKGYKIHGIDYSPQAIDICNYLRSLQTPEVQERTSFERLHILGPVKEREHKYDSVWSSHTFEHIKDPAPIFNALKVLTKDGAHMLISVPFADNYDNPDHVHHWYTTKEFEDFLSQFVDVESVKRNGSCMRAVCVLNK